MFKVNNTNTRMTSTLFPFEQANVGWEDTKTTEYYCYKAMCNDIKTKPLQQRSNNVIPRRRSPVIIFHYCYCYVCTQFLLLSLHTIWVTFSTLTH